MSATSHPLTSATLPKNAAVQLKDAGRLLSRTLATLAGNCEYKSVSHPKAKSLLSDMHSQAVDAQALVEKSYAGLDHHMAATELSETLMSQLSTIFIIAKDQLDRDFLGGDFDNQVQKAVGLNRWFTLNADRVNANLRKYQAAASGILRQVLEASDRFLSDRTRLSDKTRNETEAKRTGSEAKQTYSAVLESDWKYNKFNLNPNFHQERMDLLSIPSVDKEMQLLGSDWAKQTLGDGRPRGQAAKGQEPTTHAILQADEQRLRRIIQADEKIREIVGELRAPEQETESNIRMPTDVILKWLSITNDLGQDLRSKKLRIGVFGIVKHGKTSIINSLIGRVLLHAEEMAATAWPLLVVHKPGRKIPFVKVDPEHFQPYLEFIRLQRFSDRWKRPSDVGEDHYIPPQDLNDFAATARLSVFLQLDELRAFENPKYHFPQETEDAKLIKEAFRDINKLMRSCYVLASDTAPFPALKNAEWPRVEVEFATWGSNPIKVELLDLPGLDEIDTRTPEHIFTQAMQMGVDGCIVAVARQAASERCFADMMEIQTHRSYHEPALAAFVTHSERKGSPRDIQIKVATSVWKDHRAESRAVFCSPGLYASAVTAMIHSFDKTAEELIAPGSKVLADPSAALKNLSDFWDSLPCTAAVYDILDGEPDQEQSQIAYEGYDCGQWKSALDGLVKRCRQADLVKHFERYVLQHGADRRQLYKLTQARTDLCGLMALQSDLISILLNVILPNERSLETSNTDLHLKALAALEPWLAGGEAQQKNLEETLNKELGDARDQATAIVNDVVRKGMPSMELELTTQDAALTFINGRGGEIKRQLADLARQFVSKIRGIAREVWASRMKSLANKLREIYVQLPLELTDTLRANAVDPDQAVQDATTKEIATTTKDPSTAGTQWKQAKAKPWLSHQIAQAELTEGKGKGPELVLSPAERAVVDAVNRLGYLLRAPVSGDAKTSPLFSDSNWPRLAGAYPVDLGFDEVTTTFIAALVEPWIEILGMDSRTSVLGSVATASDIAADQLKAIIKRRTEWHEEAQKTGRKGLVESGVINQLVLQQARCSLLYGAIDEICDRWMDELSVVLPKVYKASQQKEKQANVVFAAEDKRFPGGPEF